MSCVRHMHTIYIFGILNRCHKAKCIYCAITIFCHSKIHGTSSLRNHMLAYKKNPHSKYTRQALLTFKLDVEASENVGLFEAWKFDQDQIRAALSKMIIIDELPFKFVEGEGFKQFVVVVCPRFKIPSRWTVSRDCFNSYIEERVKLKNYFKSHSNRVCLTTDSWTSIQRINYMCITTHFINDEWRLNKKIMGKLRFAPCILV